VKDYSTYIFDLDGTITDTVSVWLDIFREGLIHFGITPPEDKVLALHTHHWNEMIKLGLPEEKVEEFGVFARNLAAIRLPDAPFHASSYEMLFSLKNRGKQVAIFSTMGRLLFDPVMQHRNLYPVIDVAVAGNDVPYSKPHPAGILKALQDLEIPKEEYSQAAYIGDKDTDLQAANNAGIDGVLFYPSSHQAMYDLEELKRYNPAHVITHWKELITLSS
jgi:phosphoglycolate phosphatase